MDIDVEPVEKLTAVDDDLVPSGVDAPSYVLYGGKGGVGKTTMAAATALASARDDTPTLVVSTDPAHSLSDTLEADIPDEPTQIREEIPLFAAEIDPDTALQEGPLGDEGGPLAGLFGGGESPMGGAVPGSDELAAIRMLLAYLDDPRFERVVVDTAPTGHTLRLLELPEMLDSMVGRFMTMRERMSGMMEGLNPFGEESEAEGIDSLEAFSEQIERLRGLLRDPTQTDFRVVMVPEQMSVLESQRLVDRLDGFAIPVGTVVVNRVMQDPAELTEFDPDLFVTPNHTDCDFCAQRWEVQQRALADAQDLFRNHAVRRVPLFAEEVRGEQLLQVVAACLAE